MQGQQNIKTASQLRNIPQVRIPIYAETKACSYACKEMFSAY